MRREVCTGEDFWKRQLYPMKEKNREEENHFPESMVILLILLYNSVYSWRLHKKWVLTNQKLLSKHHGRVDFFFLSLSWLLCCIGGLERQHLGFRLSFKATPALGSVLWFLPCVETDTWEASLLALSAWAGRSCGSPPENRSRFSVMSPLPLSVCPFCFVFLHFGLHRLKETSPSQPRN